MYGVLVGKAIEKIELGAPITTENIKHATQSYTTTSQQYTWNAPDVSAWNNRTFMGYHRVDGRVGTANYWVVVPLVFCENRNVRVMQEAFEKELGYAKSERYRNQVSQLVRMYQSGQELPNAFSSHASENPGLPAENRIFPQIDGIRFLLHEGGCGGTRQDAQALCNLLAGYIGHPNVAGATVLSLGCQNAQIPMLEEAIYRLHPQFDKPLLIYEQQRGSEYNLMSEAIGQTFKGLAQANELKRRPAPLSKLVLGMECGGSDGFSGISANPSMGQCADYLVALGGTVFLAEFPELCGVEQELINRCASPAIAERFSELMKAYAASAEAVGSGFDMNPSPGNIKDGLITDAIKSAGAARKGGTSPVVDVLDYGEYVSKTGLNLVCSPGNDVESTTAMAGAGANIMLFSTGLGTPTGNPISPVIKVATNTALAQRMPDIIDINTGPVVSGEKNLEQMGAEILEYVIQAASGEVVPKAVQLGQTDFIPWKRGVSL